MADFQAVIASDGKQTQLMYNYDQERFTWAAETFRKVAIGYSESNYTGNVKFNSSTFINANKEGSSGNHPHIICTNNLFLSCSQNVFIVFVLKNILKGLSKMSIFMHAHV